jgi:hypothetical protein
MIIPPGSIVSFFDERDDDKSMLIGGFYVPRNKLADVDRVVGKIKESWGVPQHAPVKWNLKDSGYEEARKAIGDETDKFRSQLFAELRKLDIRLLMSFVWKGEKSYNVEAWKWSFENILQRLCIILDRKKAELGDKHDYPFLDVVFDWLPRAKKIDEYFEVYSVAYHKGYQFVRNKLPALRTCKACPCLLVTSTRHSPALQVTDMLLGAVGDFFTWVFKRRREESVKCHFVKLYNLFHCDDDGSVVGKGLIVSKNTQERIKKKLRELELRP